MKQLLMIIACVATVTFSYAQRKKDKNKPDTTKPSEAPKPPSPPKGGPKKFEELITDKAVKQTGFFNVYLLDDKYYFEIPDSLLKREIMTVTRFSKVAGGAGMYGGEEVNDNVIEFERGPKDNIFMRVAITLSRADSTSAIYKAINNSYLDPIIAAFDIKALGKDSGSVLIDMTDFFKGDNLALGLPIPTRQKLKLQGLAPDRSYIDHIHSYPLNVEVSTVKTYGAGGPPNPMQPSPPAVDVAGVVTLELNTSFVMLPKEPMRQRLYDPRVGFFADAYEQYSDGQQRVEDRTFITRWRLEPKPADLEKWRNGELVEPAKPIVYYIDPATPKQWRPYLMAGVNDWAKAFEQAGFKNAIMAKEWPEGDSTMSLEDARYSVIRYFASDIENAYGPNVHDPRTGEILESHVGWYHNVMQLVHDWYMVQTAAVDPKARHMKLDDSLMGQLIRFVSSHEIGHTLGLRHNYGSSSTVPVEMLRNKAWLDQHGHTPSIMDYARFNYVAQPEDNIPEYDLFPRIGEYDRWAIEWGYKRSGADDPKTDHNIVNRWIMDSLQSNPRLWFGTETNPFDPRSQSEALGDNAVLASNYGIKNLQRILPQLPEWTKEEADTYGNLKDIYQQVLGQYSRYMGHVLRNIGGVLETPKSIEQQGAVYDPNPVAQQKEALAFLQKQLFTTPTWLLNKNILNLITNPTNQESLEGIQAAVLNSLLSPTRLNRMVVITNRFGNDTYPVEAYLKDVQKAVFFAKPDSYQRNLQKIFVDDLINILNPVPVPGPFQPLNVKETDIPSIARAQLTVLRNELLLLQTNDAVTKYHYQDLIERIKRALDPK